MKPNTGGLQVLTQHIINLRTNQVHVISFMQQLLNNLRKSLQCALNRRLAEPLSQCGHLGQNNLLSADSWILVPFSSYLFYKMKCTVCLENNKSNSVLFLVLLLILCNKIVIWEHHVLNCLVIHSAKSPQFNLTGQVMVQLN